MWAHMCNCICKCLFYSFFVLSPVQKSHLSCPLLCNLQSLPSQRLDIDRERREKYPLLFACEVGASVCHPLETISADGLEFVHGGQLCWQHQRWQTFIPQWLLITTIFYHYHIVCIFQCMMEKLTRGKAARELCFRHLINLSTTSTEYMPILSLLK